MLVFALTTLILYFIPPLTSDAYVTVVKGSLPLILSCPHGGFLKPESIPDRKRKAPGTVFINDGYTIDTTYAIAHAMADMRDDAKRPSVVVCNVARIKVDVNRPVEKGTDSKESRAVWIAYHDALNTLIQTLLDRYGYALLLDIHGHGAKHGLVELGYLLRQDELELIRGPDDMNAAVLARSSIRHLAHRTAVPEPHELLRGSGSMGGLMEKAHPQIRTVPSPSRPYPNVTTDHYFRGGYTTQVYSAAAPGLDVIQIELPRHLRFTPEGRNTAATAVAEAANYLLEQHYTGLNRPTPFVHAKL